MTTLNRLPPDANDFARMIDRYNREMQKYVHQAADIRATAAPGPKPEPEPAVQPPPGREDIPPQPQPMPLPEPQVPPEPLDPPERPEPLLQEPPRPRTREIPYPRTGEELATVPVIPTQVTPSAEAPTPDARFPRDSVGFLQVWATSARGVFPVENATVTVSGVENGVPILYRTVFTDESGLTPLMALPTVSAQLSMRPGNVQPFTLYTVQIEKDGFFPVENTGVPIYEGIIARQPVNLVPLPEDHRQGATQVFPEGGPADL